jgi:protein-S-isoprenylcysteine O-methyltransferase Ste14
MLDSGKEHCGFLLNVVRKRCGPRGLFESSLSVHPLTRTSMNLRTLIGAGEQITAATLPFALAGIILNAFYPDIFTMNLSLIGIVFGTVFLFAGVPIWLISAIQVLIHVPRGELITTGPFKVVLHPLYTSVALLVLPGIGFILDTWVALAIGVVLYICSRLFSVKEERNLQETFPDVYPAYRAKVILPWL